MEKNEKVFSKIKVFALALIFWLLMIFVNSELNNADFFKYLSTHAFKIIGYILSALFGVEVVNLVCRSIYKRILKKSKKVSNDVKKATQKEKNEKVVTATSPNNMLINALCLWPHIEEAEVGNLLKLLKDNFDTKKSDISYFFLSNQGNNLIANFLFEFSDFRSSCQIYSKQIAEKLIDKDSNNADFDNFNNLKDVTDELIHFSLTCTQAKFKDHIRYIKKILSKVEEEIQNKDLYQNDDLRRFFIMLPFFEKRIKKNEIDDEEIKQHIDNIKNSSCLKKMIKHSYKRLSQFDTKSLNTQYASLLVAYPEKLNIFYRICLTKKVKEKLRLFDNQYHENYDMAIPLLLAAKPLGCVDDVSQDLADDILNIIDGLYDLSSLMSSV